MAQGSGIADLPPSPSGSEELRLELSSGLLKKLAAGGKGGSKGIIGRGDDADFADARSTLEDNDLDSSEDSDGGSKIRLSSAGHERRKRMQKRRERTSPEKKLKMKLERDRLKSEKDRLTKVEKDSVRNQRHREKVADRDARFKRDLEVLEGFRKEKAFEKLKIDTEEAEEERELRMAREREDLLRKQESERLRHEKRRIEKEKERELEEKRRQV
jgi:hypothetical protein